MATTTSARALFAGSSHAHLYSKFRPVIPSVVVDRIVDYLRRELQPDGPFRLAVDVGCGSGQSTNAFARFFGHVIGVDVSEAQIEEAVKKETHPNVQYHVGSASSIPVKEGGQRAELVTAFEAAHWFDLDAFYREVDRILVPNGVLAITGYNNPELVDPEEKREEVAEHFRRIRTHDLTSKYYHENVRILENGYREIVPPFADVIRETVVDYFDSTVAELTGFLRSWSSVQSLKREHPDGAEEVVAGFRNKLMTTLGDVSDDTKHRFRLEYFIVMCRKPAS